MRQAKLKKWLLGSVFAAALSISLIACDNKNKTDVANQPNGFQSCVNCAGIAYGQEFLRTLSQGNSGYLQVQLNLGFSGTNGSVYNMSYPVQYQGPVAVTGSLVVPSQVSQGYCTLPGGSYTIGTLQTGMWSMAGIVTNLRMHATGPANLIVSITQGQIASGQNRDMYGNVLSSQRLFANFVIDSVNGMPCGASMIVQ